jgi:hypothetical protein
MSARKSVADALARIPRADLVDAPTPIQPLKRIEEVMGPALNGVKLYVKRDDLFGQFRGAFIGPGLFRQGLRWRDRRRALRPLLWRFIAGVLDDRRDSGAVRLSTRLCTQGRLTMTADRTAVFGRPRPIRFTFPQSSITRRFP